MKKSILIAGMALLVLPTFIHAAWWNPLTWGKDQIGTPEQMNELRAQGVIETPVGKEKSSDITTTVARDPKEVPAPMPKEKYVSDERKKEVTRPMNTTDAVLQSQIDSLKYENDLLRKQMSQMKDLYNSCQKELTDMGGGKPVNVQYNTSLKAEVPIPKTN
jgi:hypothetical protein